MDNTVYTYCIIQYLKSIKKMNKMKMKYVVYTVSSMH